MPKAAPPNPHTGRARRYHELNVGQTIFVVRADGRQVQIWLEAFDERSITVRVDGSRARIPLGHFADRRLGNPPGDVPNVIEIAGIKIGADVNRAYMAGTRYSKSLVNLQRDARLTIGEEGEPLSPPGQHASPLPEYDWNHGENWLQAVPYGWHLGVDLDAERGHPLLAITDSTVVALRRFDAAQQEEDYWGNNLALLGDDGILYCYMHWERLAEGVEVGSRVQVGQVVGMVGRSGFESKPFATHLHLEMMILNHPERFTFAYALEPEVLPTPNRFLQAEVEGYAVCPYPYLVEWYGQMGK